MAIGHISRIYNFQPGTKILSGQVDAELDQLISYVNSLDDQNNLLATPLGAGLIGSSPIPNISGGTVREQMISLRNKLIDDTPTLSQFTTHTNDMVKHITHQERTSWNDKPSNAQFSLHTEDNSRHVNTGERSRWNDTPTLAQHGAKVDKITGKQLSTEDYTTAEKSKLAGIQAGAQVNTVTSVAGKTGAVTLSKSDVGLGNVDNTSDINKPVSTAQQAAINAVQSNLDTHANSKVNPHAVTKAQVGLGNADNTSDVNKPVSTAQSAAINAVQTNLNTHDANQVKHITASERTRWNDTPTLAQHGAKVDKITGKQLSTEDYTTAEKSKLAGIQAGAQVNTVTSVAGKTGAVTLSKSDVGLGNVDNTSDINKPVSTAQGAAINAVQTNLNTHTNNENVHVTSTDKTNWNSKLSSLNSVSPLSGNIDIEGGTGITVTPGEGKVTVTATGDATPGPHAASHATNGSDPISPASIGLGNVDNTSDLNKPVSTAQAAAIAAHTNDKTNPHSVTKSQVGLGNVDNTSDLNKPISTLQQAALDGKANISHTHSTSDLTDTLPVSKGGTGATTAAGARSALGITPANIGAATQAQYTATVSTSWSGSGPYTQNVTVSGLLSTDNPIVGPVLSATLETRQAQQEAWNMVSRITTSNNTLSLTCDEYKPTVAIPIQIMVVR